MVKQYKIPLKFKTGKYHLGQLPKNNNDSLVLSLSEYDVLSYSVPKYETEVNIYSVTEEIINNTLSAIYDELEQLKYIEITCNNKANLVYINFPDNQTAKETVIHFSYCEAEDISYRIIEFKQRLARIFVEYFYDGVCVDFAAKIGTVEDIQSVIESYAGEDAPIDNCGDYPLENRIECNCADLEIMLLCTSPDFRSKLFRLVVDTMINQIKKRVLDIIKKTEDFKFLIQEYD